MPGVFWQRRWEIHLSPDVPFSETGGVGSWAPGDPTHEGYPCAATALGGLALGSFDNSAENRPVWKKLLAYTQSLRHNAPVKSPLVLYRAR